MVTTLEPPKPLDRVLQYLTNNKIGKIRKETFQGQEHYVVPVAMIVPGVLPGSKGSLYYPKEEIANNHKAWNNIPIVVYHPIINGQPVSAREPEILNTQAIGVVLNARINRVGKLIAEGWFNVELTKKVDNRIYDSLVKGELIELSTGLYTDNHPVENGDNYQGVAYTHIARNYRPDHLAILPDQKGACSIADGCGVGVENKLTEPEDFDEEEVTDNGCGCSTCEKGDECPCKLSAKEIIGREMLNNELSLSEIPMGLDKLIRDRYGSGYVTDVYKAYVVYKQNDHYYSVPYSVDKQDNINLTGSTTKVRRKVQYMPVTNVLNAVDLLTRENRPLPSARSLLLNHPTGHNEKAHGRGGGGGGGSSGGGGGSSGGKATSVKSVKQLPKAGTPFKVGKSNYVEVTGSARSNKKIQRFVTSGGNAVKRGKAAPLKMKAADNAFSLERGQKVFRKVD